MQVAIKARCPNCRGNLVTTEDGLQCIMCSREFDGNGKVVTMIPLPIKRLPVDGYSHAYHDEGCNKCGSCLKCNTLFCLEDVE